MRSLLDGRSETARLVSAFVDLVEELRFGGGRRWSLVGEPGGIGVWTVSRGRAHRVGTVESLPGKVSSSMRAGLVDLRLDPDKMVSAALRLPAEAREFAGPFVEHSLEKLTPWQSDKVLYGYSVGAPGADGQSEVRLLATSREIAESLLAPARALGLDPVALGSAAEPLERLPQINLLPEASTDRSRRRRIIGAASLAVLLLSLGAFGASQWLAMQVAEQQTALEAKLAATRRALAEDAGNAGGRNADLAMIQRKTPQGAAFVLIDRLATLLPDGTVLDELEVAPRTVRIAGTSADASALVGLLEADAFLRDAEFGAPVTRQLDGRDRFDISLVRVPAGGQDGP